MVFSAKHSYHAVASPAILVRSVSGTLANVGLDIVRHNVEVDIRN
jgi:hypothetical protein